MEPSRWKESWHTKKHFNKYHIIQVDNNQMCLNKHKSNYLKTQVAVNTTQTSIWVKKFTLSSYIESHVFLAPFWMYHYYSLILKQTGDATCVGVSIVWVMDWLGKWQRWYWPSQRKITHIFQREKIHGINFMGLWTSVSLLWQSSFLYTLFERFIREKLTLPVPLLFLSNFQPDLWYFF